MQYIIITMASVDETLTQINKVLKESSSGPYSQYSCKTVSWDDVQRGTVGQDLSCWGSNITDTRLYAKDGRQLFTVRGDNWNERLGVVRSDELALIADNTDGGGGSENLRPITLRTLLANLHDYGSYAGIHGDETLNVYEETLDDKVSVRFQTTFLPVEEGEGRSRGTLEFAPEAYNYNTTRDDDPRNLVLLCTTQGLAIQQDGEGAKKLFHHAKDKNSGEIHRYWLEAESTSHKVGGSQKETKEEKEDALKRGKATSTVIGTRAIGTRFNVLMTIQVPLKQRKAEIQPYASMGCFYGVAAPNISCCDSEEVCDDDSADEFSAPSAVAFSAPTGMMFRYRQRRSSSPKQGKSSAARVSRGSLHDTTWEGLSVEKLERHHSEHVTATVVMYYTCSGGVPTAEDVKTAVDDLEELYQAVEVNGKLADADFDFMKSELTVKDVADIRKKLVTQPPPVSCPVTDGDIFPM